MNLFKDLEYRGLIKDYSNAAAIEELLNTPQTIYCGFDPSAASMHMGNFVMVMTLMRFQRAGHRVLAIVGGATGMVGDPGGRKSERMLLDKAALNHNTRQIHDQLAKYIDLDDPKRGKLINNFDWLGKISHLEFLRDYGKYFTVNYMLAKDTVARRLADGISYTEFSYMLLQAVDFLHLYENEGCTMQIGGSDQWGNLVTGLDLIKKVKGSDAKVEVMTAHLLTNSEGEKFGKSVDGAMFIDPEKFSPYKLYQYFINVSDESAYKYLKVLTFMDKAEIESLYSEHLKAPHLRLAQKRLAEEVVVTVHSSSALAQALKMSEALFSGEVKSLNEKEIETLFADVMVPLAKDIFLEDALLVLNAAKSKREAREFISGNSISVNGEKVSDLKATLSSASFLFNKYVIIRRGKKLYFVGKLA